MNNPLTLGEMSISVNPHLRWRLSENWGVWWPRLYQPVARTVQLQEAPLHPLWALAQRSPCRLSPGQPSTPRSHLCSTQTARNSWSQIWKPIDGLTLWDAWNWLLQVEVSVLTGEVAGMVAGVMSSAAVGDDHGAVVSVDPEARWGAAWRHDGEHGDL